MPATSSSLKLVSVWKKLKGLYVSPGSSGKDEDKSVQKDRDILDGYLYPDVVRNMIHIRLLFAKYSMLGDWLSRSPTSDLER